MKICNEYGVIVHEPTKALESELYDKVAAHLKSLAEQGASLTELRAVHSCFTIGLCNAISQTLLTEGIKMRKQNERNEALESYGIEN